jgi:plasmid stabilization system protein ParE
MPQLKWSANSLKDVQRLHDFLAEKSPDAARRAVTSIREGVRALERFPQMGRPVDDLAAEFREWVIEFGQGAYVVLYHVDASEVVLLAIRHGREVG